MIYTALGDSITYGESASSIDKAYPQLALASPSTSCRRTAGHVLARPGWSSSQLLRAVIWRGTPLIRSSTVVSLWIGGVDLAYAALYSVRSGIPLPFQPSAAKFRRNYSSILNQIRRNSCARIFCFTQYNPFPNSPLACEKIDRLNEMIREQAHSFNATVVPAHHWFEGRQAELIYGYQTGRIEDALGGFKPIHPNDQGHRVIAKGLVPYLASR